MSEVLRDPLSGKRWRLSRPRRYWRFPKLGVIVLCDPWNVYAYGAHGEVWRAGDIATDGFKITGIDAGSISIEVERDVDDIDRLRIEVGTGKVTRE
jgi:hypothetical protein